MADATLLVELLTEELPPKSLERLSLVLRDEIASGLARHGLVRGEAGAARAFATPRRLAVLLPGVVDRAPDRRSEVQGPSVSAPAKAAEGFAKKQGLAVDALEQRDTPKGTRFPRSK